MRFLCPKCQEIVSVEHSEFVADCPRCHAPNVVPLKARDKNAIIGDFVLQNVIGKGGMGVVYLVRQLGTNRVAALKILLDKHTNNSEFVVQFLLEARAAAGLNHPNIVQAYAAGEEDKVFYFAMEYIDGPSAKEELKARGKIPPVEASKWVRDIADALDFAWKENRMVHHDIKPDNILLERSGRAKLADLGLARVADTPIGIDYDQENVLGTPQYISPEQLMGEPCDTRSDIYSLGATFYHLLTGEYPFAGANANDTAQMHVSSPLKSPMEVDKTIPESLSNIIVKMMRKKPDERYNSGRDVVAALNSYLVEADPRAESSTKRRECAIPQRKKFWWITVSFLAIFLGGSLALFKGASTKDDLDVNAYKNSSITANSTKMSIKKLSYRERIEELTAFFRNNPSNEMSFLTQMDEFLQDFPEPQSIADSNASRAVLDAYGRIDERLRINPARTLRELEHQKSIGNRRHQFEQNQKRLADEKHQKSEDEKRRVDEAKHQAEAEKRQIETLRQQDVRQKHQEQQQAKRKQEIANYVSQLERARITLLRRFLAAVETNNSEEFREFVGDTQKQYSLDKDSSEVEKSSLAYFVRLANGLLNEYDLMRQFAAFMQNSRQVTSIQFEPKRGDFWQLTGVDAENQAFRLYSVIEDKAVQLPYSDRLVADKLLPALGRRNKDSLAVFRLFLWGRNFSNITPYLPESGFWRENWAGLVKDCVRDAYLIDPEKAKNIYSGLPEYNQLKQTETL